MGCAIHKKTIKTDIKTTGIFYSYFLNVKDSKLYSWKTIK